MLEGAIIDYCYKHNIIVDALIELTYKCNLRCKHCYIGDRKKILLKENALTILDKLYEEGTINLSLTGGEIFLHPDFEEIYKYAKSKGFIIELKTNALLLNEHWVNYFKNNLPEEINITVYGLSNEDYYAFTGDCKGFDKLKNALDLLYKAKIYFSLHVISTTHNYEDIINGLYKKFFEIYDVDFGYDYDMLSGIDGDLEPLNYRLTPEQIIRLENNEHFFLDSIEQEYTAVKNRNQSPFICYAGVNKICFDPDGKASSCLFDDKVK